MAEILPFLTVFAIIAGFEFLDRTNFALLSLAAKEPPIPVWIGAAGAFVLSTAISIAIGGVLVALLQGELYLVRLGAGILILAYAAYLAFHHGAEKNPRAGRSALTTAFLMILVLEFGDNTMFVTINFVVQYGDPILVGVAAALGLLFVAATACILGPRLGARVEPLVLEKVVIVILAAVGAITVVYALDPGLFPSWAA